jgi:hypothetical protein
MAPETESVRLERLFEEHWAIHLRENPELATYFGSPMTLGTTSVLIKLFSRLPRLPYGVKLLEGDGKSSAPAALLQQTPPGACTRSKTRWTA